MCPEQVVGEVADTRADIWAFGVVLYEMLCGVPPFRGADGERRVAEVMRRPNPIGIGLPSETPAGIRRLLKRCLRKERARRLHDIVRCAHRDRRRCATSPTQCGLSSARRSLLWALAAALALVTRSRSGAERTALEPGCTAGGGETRLEDSDSVWTVRRRWHRSHIARWAKGGLSIDLRRGSAIVAAVVGFGVSTPPQRHGQCDPPFLVTRRPIPGVLRRRPPQAHRPRRRCITCPGRCGPGPRWCLERRRDDRVRPPVHGSAAARVRERRLTSRGHTVGVWTSGPRTPTVPAGRTSPAVPGEPGRQTSAASTSAASAARIPCA